MSEKSILFSTDMVRAILAGSKTQTRRVVKAGNHAVIRGGTFPGALDGPKYGAELDNRSVIVAPYQKGDILYVRETWSFLPCATCGQRNCLLKPTRMETADGEKDGCILYRADGENPVFSTGHIWRPSIHMPKKAVRIFLRVTDVRMERLRAVNFFDCIAEGMPYKQFETEIIEDFRKVWDRTIKPAEREKYGWDANPWVWAYTFQRE